MRFFTKLMVGINACFIFLLAWVLIGGNIVEKKIFSGGRR